MKTWHYSDGHQYAKSLVFWRACAKVFTSLMRIYYSNSYPNRKQTDRTTVQAALALSYNHKDLKRPFRAYYSYCIDYHQLFYGGQSLNYSTPYCLRCMHGMTYYLHDQIWPRNDQWPYHTINDHYLICVSKCQRMWQCVKWMNETCMNMNNVHSMEMIKREG